MVSFETVHFVLTLVKFLVAVRRCWGCTLVVSLELRTCTLLPQPRFLKSGELLSKPYCIGKSRGLVLRTEMAMESSRQSRDLIAPYVFFGYVRLLI